jgi:uroporphyrinogen-III synthase
VAAFRIAGDASGTRVFLPASAVAREELPRGLRELGARVDQVTAYRMVTLPLDAGACREALEADQVQVVTFASPSAMVALKEGIGEEMFRGMAREIPAAAMGPTTGGALREAGWRRVVLADSATLDGLATAAVEAARMTRP